MRRVFGYVSAAILLVFPVLLSATFPPVATNTWSAAQPLSAARSGAATVMLQDGRLLITGGNNGTSSVASVDIVDTAGNITAAAPMNMARSQHTATVLQDGRVLVVGGVDVSGNPIGTAEIFDPSVNPARVNPWTSTGPLVQARSGQTATLLNDGTVLIAGGLSGGQVLNTLELFNAASGANGSFTIVSATLSSPRAKHTAVLLEDGRVMIIGGWDGTMTPPQPPATSGTPNPLATTDIYDASAQQVRAGPALNVGRMSLTATTQLDGQVFVAGGNDGTHDLASTEIFDPITSPQPATFTRSSLSLTTPRSNHLAFLLPHNGGTLLVGGTSNGTAIASAELYMPVYLSQAQTATLTPAAAMNTARAYATGSPLSDGTVTSVNDGLLIVAGGVDASGNTLSSAEFFAFPWVKTDALEYAPGTPVNITGGGFQPGETVTLHFQETPYYDAPADLTATVQPDGTFSNSQFSPDTYDLNIGFFLTATGSASHNQAQTVFADNYSKNNLTIAVSPAAGTPVANSVVAGTNGSGSSDIIGACTTTSGCSNSNAIGSNKTISITATAGTGYVFSSWTVSVAPAGSTCANGSAANPCTLNSGTGNNTTSVTANFLTPVTATLTAAGKVYDGTATEPNASMSCSLTAVHSGDNVTCTATNGSFATPNAGSGTVTAAVALGGSDSAKYVLTSTSATAPATISQKALTYTGLSAPASKIYDATTNATVSGTPTLQTAEAAGAGTTSDGKPYSVDAVSLTGTPSGAYNTKDVATATTVSIGGISLTGTGNGNYSLTAATQSATITPKALTYTGLSAAASKIYDATTNATVTGTATLQPAEAAGAGSTSDGKPYTGDAVSLIGTPTGSYDSKDVASATTVTFGGVSLS
ncbi:MAG TPA: YDG domain-containing protein, partial [Terracidiphilus sp.]|nr:YDG domain-containing protein [Terracidiphilus sp.]